MLEPDSLPITPGSDLIWDMPEAVYHADPCPTPSLSSSIAKKLVHETPLHAWTAHPRLNPYHEPQHKDAFDLGSTAHMRLLGKGAEVVVVDAEDWRTKAAREARDTARAEGKTPILRKDSDRVDAMVEAAHLQLTAIGVGDVFSRAIDREVTFIAEVDGVLCRCRVDALGVERRESGPVLIAYDYKTTPKIPTPDELPKLLANLGYDIQDDHYTSVVTAATGLPCEMRFVVQEKSDPHLLAVTSLSPLWRQDAQRAGKRAREVWRRCLEENAWYGLPGDIIEVDAPAFHAQTLEGREARRQEIKHRHGQDILDRSFRLQAPEPLPAPEAAQ